MQTDSNSKITNEQKDQASVKWACQFYRKIRPSMFMIKSNGMNKLMYNSVFAETAISQSQILSPGPPSN